MKRSALAGLSVAGLAAAGAIALVGLFLRDGGPPAGDARPVAPGRTEPSTLYCEFFNFSDRNPRVGFYFAIEETQPSSVYRQIFRRESDGSQTDYGEGDTPRPAWTFGGTDNPASIRSSDDETEIVLYDYDGKRAGTTWFEAGLRSNDYKNLGGKCRLSAT